MILVGFVGSMARTVSSPTRVGNVLCHGYYLLFCRLFRQHNRTKIQGLRSTEQIVERNFLLVNIHNSLFFMILRKTEAI
jgi:hypothetical protein